jgi:drug/metabolite transporter (DMT)-like permease
MRRARNASTRSPYRSTASAPRSWIGSRVRATAERPRAALLALAALALIWGYNWVVMKVGVRDAPPFTFAAIRALGGAVVLLLVGLVQRRPLRPAHLWPVFWIGFFQTSCFLGFATWAVVSAGAGQVAMLAYTMPLWVALIAWPVLGERIGVPQAIAIGIAFAGIACMIGPLHKNAFADVLAVAAGLTWAIGVILAKRLQQRARVDLFSLTLWQMIGGGVVLGVVALAVRGPAIVWSTPLVLSILYASIAATALAYLLFLYVLRALPAREASMGTLANPVIGVLFGWLQLGEAPSVLSLIGMGLIVAGLAVLSLAGQARS